MSLKLPGDSPAWAFGGKTKQKPIRTEQFIPVLTPVHRSVVQSIPHCYWLGTPAGNKSSTHSVRTCSCDSEHNCSCDSEHNCSCDSEHNCSCDSEHKTVHVTQSITVHVTRIDVNEL